VLFAEKTYMCAQKLCHAIGSREFFTSLTLALMSMQVYS